MNIIVFDNRANYTLQMELDPPPTLWAILLSDWMQYHSLEKPHFNEKQDNLL